MLNWVGLLHAQLAWHPEVHWCLRRRQRQGLGQRTADPSRAWHRPGRRVGTVSVSTQTRICMAMETSPMTSRFVLRNSKTSGYAMVVHGRPKTPKNTSFWGSPSPPGSYSPYILGDTTRPAHVTCVLVWSKSDRRRLKITLHKQTDTTKIMVTWPWTNKCSNSESSQSHSFV